MQLSRASGGTSVDLDWLPGLLGKLDAGRLIAVVLAIVAIIRSPQILDSIFAHIRESRRVNAEVEREQKKLEHVLSKKPRPRAKRGVGGKMQ